MRDNTELNLDDFKIKTYSFLKFVKCVKMTWKSKWFLGFWIFGLPIIFRSK